MDDRYADSPFNCVEARRWRPILTGMQTILSRRVLIRMFGSAIAVPAVRLRAAASRPAAPDIIDIATATGRISRVHHWRARARRGIILFSHGALSSPAKYDRLILPWVAAGFDVWAPLHVDSTDHPDTQSFTGFMSWRARIEDMRALSAHIGAGPKIAAGHSYGALTALTLGGAAADVPDGLSGPLRDPDVRAVVAFSPPGPIKGLIPPDGYATLAVPALIQTGDRDIPLGIAAAAADSWKAHLAPFEASAPGGDRYALILTGVDHFFGGLICWLDQPGPPQTAQLHQASALSTDFLKAFGAGSKKARRSLDSRLASAGPVIVQRK